MVGRWEPALPQDRQQERPAGRCGRCGGEVYRGERVYRWRGEKLCLECFQDAVCSLVQGDPTLAAAQLGAEWTQL